MLKYFTPNEFPEDIKYADKSLLYSLDDLRGFIGVPIYPSPVPGALARFGNTTSMHKIPSKAIDVFIQGDTAETYTKILQSGLFNGVGVYFDTYYRNKSWVMFHLDKRDKKLIWYRDKYVYHYPQEEDFYERLYTMIL